jgi:hypothetical protein
MQLNYLNKNIMNLRLTAGLLAFSIGISVASQSFAQNSNQTTVLRPYVPASEGIKLKSLDAIPKNAGHFVAQTKHLLTLVKKYPAPVADPWFGINGVKFWPANPINQEGIKILDAEQAGFNASMLKAALQCGKPQASVAGNQIVLIDIKSTGVAVPIFLTPDADELGYVELSLDRPGKPVALIVRTYKGIALRVTTSPGTTLTTVHLQTYYPSVVLGVNPNIVTQQFNPGSSAENCNYRFGNESDTVPLLQYLGFDAAKAVMFKHEQPTSKIAIGSPQKTKFDLPLLGSFLDPDMPVPHNYGIAVLANLGYVRPVRIKIGEEKTPTELLEVLKPFQIPANLFGSHSVKFLLPRGTTAPSGGLSHSTLFQEVR